VLGGLAKTYCTISRSALLGFEDVLGIIMPRLEKKKRSWPR